MSFQMEAGGKGPSLARNWNPQIQQPEKPLMLSTPTGSLDNDSPVSAVTSIAALLYTDESDQTTARLLTNIQKLWGNIGVI
jgi:hypothetical protein